MVLVRYLGQVCWTYRQIGLTNMLLERNSFMCKGHTIMEMNNIMYAPLDPNGRDYKNLYQIIQDNEMIDLLNEERFGNLFSAFYKLIDFEKKYFNEINK